MTRPFPLVAVGMALILVLAVSVPVGASTAMGGRGGLARIDIGSTHVGDFNGGIGWNSAGVSYDAGTYLQRQQLVATAFTTNTNIPVHYPGTAPVMGSVLGPAGGSVPITAPAHLGIFRSLSTVRNPMNCRDISSIQGYTGCTPNRNAYAAQLIGAAIDGARETGTYFIEKIPGAAEVGLVAKYAGIIAGLRQSDALQPITAEFNYFNGRCSADREILTNTATFDIRTTNPNPASFTAEWKHELSTAPGSSHRWVSSAARLHRGQLPVRGDGIPIEERPSQQGPAYGFGLAGVERPLWTPSHN